MPLDDLFDPPQELASAPREALQEFAKRIAVGVAASLDFAARVNRDAPSITAESLAACYEAAYDAASASALEARLRPREWALSFAHDCSHLGCREPSCSLCAHNPRRVCPGALAPKGLAGDALRAACGSGARVELVRVGGGEGEQENGDSCSCIHPRSGDVVVELTVLDGKAYQALLDQGRGGDEAATLGCALLQNNNGNPLLVSGGGGSGGGGSGGSKATAAAAAARAPSTSSSARALSSASATAFTSSAAVAAAVVSSLTNPDGRVLLGLTTIINNSHSHSRKKDKSDPPPQPQSSSFAPLADVSVTGSSESLLSGQRPPFRLLARALDATTGAPLRDVAFAVSDAFVVATPRVRTAVKAEIPMSSDHVSKLNAVGPQTQAKLLDVAAAWKAAAATGGGGGGGAGGSGGNALLSSGSKELPRSLFPEHSSVTTVGQFRDLAEAASSDPELTDALKRVLKLTKGWEAAVEHAMQAVEVDSRARVWYDISSTPDGEEGGLAGSASGGRRKSGAVARGAATTPKDGLVFAGVLGAVDLSSPIGVLRSDKGGGGGSRVVALSRLCPHDASRAAEMRAEATRCWSLPGHPGWTLWEGSCSEDVAARVARADVVVGGGGAIGKKKSSSCCAAAALPLPPPPASVSSFLSSGALPTISWGAIAGAPSSSGGAAAAGAAAAGAGASAAAPRLAGGKAGGAPQPNPVPESPFAAPAPLPSRPGRRPPPPSGFAAAAAAAGRQQQQTGGGRRGSGAVDAAALQARLSALVGRQLSGLEMSRLIPTFPSVLPSAEIFGATQLDALEFSRSELARIDDWEKNDKRKTTAAAADGNDDNAKLTSERGRDESLLRFLSERLQAAPGSGGVGAGLGEARQSGLEGMLVGGGGADVAAGGGSGSKRKGGGAPLGLAGLSTLPTLGPAFTATPSGTTGADAGAQRGSRRQRRA